MPIALLPCWICLMLAGWLVRKEERDDWRREWVAELWHRWRGLCSRGEWNARAAWQLYVTGAGCFQDAWSQFAIDEDRWLALRTQMRRPVFCALTLGVAGAVLALPSHYFAATRNILSSLPYQNGSRLALVSRTGRLQSIRKGIPANLTSFWQRDGKLVEEMAECSFGREARAVIGTRAFDVTLLQASANLLDVIGETGLRRESKPAAWLSYWFWQRELKGDRNVIGKQLRDGPRTLFIAGVLPDNFWLISPSIQVYELDGVPATVQGMLLIRAKPEVSAHQLEAELSRIAERNDIPFLETAPHVLFLSDALHTPIWLFGGALLIALVAVGLGHGPRLRRTDRGDTRLRFGNWRWWAFLAAKTAAALALVFVAGVELFVGLSHQYAGDSLGGPALLWFYTAGCALVLLAVIADQQARCRVCLRCLAFPIRVGCPGCLFLDWSGTELLCPDGHGMLYVPHHVSCWDEAERWVALEI